MKPDNASTLPNNHCPDLRPLRKARVPNLSPAREKARAAIDGLLHAAHETGLDLYEVSAALDVDRKTLTRWRTGETSVPADKLLELEEFAAANMKRAVGQ